MNYLLVVAYNGASYCGFQIQPQRPSVAQELLTALGKLDPAIKELTAASRTDKGVHATKQRVVFSSSLNVPPERWKIFLNNALPKDIIIRSCRRVSSFFHPRFQVKEKEYTYLINTGPYDVYGADLEWQYNYPLSLSSLQEALSLFAGSHDFRLFTTDPADGGKEMVRVISHVAVRKQGKKMIIKIRSRGFLRAQVRMMVAAAVRVASGRNRREDIIDRLSLQRLDKWTHKAPPGGLYLTNIRYYTNKEQKSRLKLLTK